MNHSSSENFKSVKYLNAIEELDSNMQLVCPWMQLYMSDFDH